MTVLATHRCATCGSTDVQHAMWVRLNTDEVLEPFGSWCEGDTGWCERCHDHRQISGSDEKPDLEPQHVAALARAMDLADLERGQLKAVAAVARDVLDRATAALGDHLMSLRHGGVGLSEPYARGVMQDCAAARKSLNECTLEPSPAAARPCCGVLSPPPGPGLLGFFCTMDAEHQGAHEAWAYTNDRGDGEALICSWE